MSDSGFEKIIQQAFKETEFDSPDAWNNLGGNIKNKIEEEDKNKKRIEEEKYRQQILKEEEKRAYSDANILKEDADKAAEKFPYDLERPVADNCCNFVIDYISKMADPHDESLDKKYSNAVLRERIRILCLHFFEHNESIIDSKYGDNDYFIKKFRANPKTVPLPIVNAIPEVFDFLEDIDYLSSEELSKKRLTSKEVREKQQQEIYEKQQRDEEYEGKRYTRRILLLLGSLLTFTLILILIAL